jgi:hypothetical protein
MPLDLRAKFSKTAEVTFDVDEEHKHHCAKSAFKSSFRQIVRATFIDVWIIQKRYSKRNHYLENLTKISNAELNAILNVSSAVKQTGGWLMITKKMTLMIGKKYRENHE